MSYFDHYADPSTTHVGAWMVRRTKHKEFAFLHPCLPGSDCSVLEIGAGFGDLARLLFQAGYRNYRCVEPNPTMRERLARQGFSVEDYLVPPLREPDASVDAIVLIDVFEHLNDAQDAQTFIAEAYRVLRPKGVLCIASPDYLHWKEDFFDCDFSHNNVTTVRRTMQLLYNQGFRILKYQYFGGFLTGRLATAASWLTRAALSIADSNGLDKKPYKLKLTFLRRFAIVAVKPVNQDRRLS